MRQASDAAEYAKATVEVGREMGVQVLDVWGLFMGLAGWKEGDGEGVMPGSKEAERSQVLGELLCDGMFDSWNVGNE